MTAKRDNEITPGTLAAVLEIDPRTAQRWAENAINGETSPLNKSKVRRSITGRYYVERDELKRLKEKFGLYSF